MNGASAGEGRAQLEAQIRALIRSVSRGDPDGAGQVTIATLYAELGMRAEASRWMLRAAHAARKAGRLGLARSRAEAAVQLDPEHAAAHEALQRLGEAPQSS